MVALTLNDKITYALDLYDNKKGILRATVPFYHSDMIAKIREIKRQLDNGADEHQMSGKLKHFIQEDPNYPLGNSATIFCELALDGMLFDFEVYIEKYKKQFPSESPVVLLLHQNHLYFCNNIDNINKYIAAVPSESLSEALIMAAANSSTESILYVKKHRPDLIKLSLSYQANYYENNILMVALAKGRGHKESQGRSELLMGEVIDALFDSMAGMLDLKDIVNMSDRIGITPLDLAILQGDLKSVENLINMGADTFNKEFLNISYQEAGQHLDAYTSGVKERKDFLKVNASFFNMEKIIHKNIYTMPDKTTWEDSLKQIKIQTEKLSKIHNSPSFLPR